MRLDISIEETYNCFQKQLIAVSKYYGVNHQMMFLELWGFAYNESEASLGERMNLVWMGELEYRKKLLYEFHGIKLKVYDNFEEYKKDKVNVEITPVAFYIDSFECEWLPFFQNQHRQHMCNVVSVDSEFCYCQDEYIKPNEYVVLKHDRICGKVITFLSMGAECLSKVKIKEALLEAVKRYDENKSLENLKKFIKDFSIDFNFEEEFVDGNPLKSKVLMYLKCLADDKKNLAKFFRFISTYYYMDFDEIIRITESQAVQYHGIRNNLIKLFYSRKEINRERIKEALNIIYELEKKLYYSIVEIVQ